MGKGENAITDGWYTAYPITDTIYRISDNGNDNMYLLTGKVSAMLIDTGYGIGDLRAFIQRLTPLPLIVVNTHGHFDHALGNDQFETVYAGAGDMGLYSDKEREQKRNYISNAGLMVEDLRALPFSDLWGTPARKDTLPIKDGMVFDISGERLTARLTPGHSRGSVCFIAGKAGVLFAGDSYVPFEYWGPMWMHLENNAPLREFYQRMSGVSSSGLVRNMLSGHGECGLLPAGRLNSLLSGIAGIIEGRLEGKPEDTLLGAGLRIDLEGVSVIYDPKMISQDANK